MDNGSPPMDDLWLPASFLCSLPIFKWQQKLAVESLDQQHEENTSSFSFFRMKMTTSIHYPLVRTSHSSYLDVRGMKLSSVPKREASLWA